MKILFVILFCTSSFSQVYLPNGTPKEFPKNSTVGEIQKAFDPQERFTMDICKYDEEYVVVYYKFFTNKPLFIITDTKKYLKKSLKHFNFSKYMRGPLVEIDLKRYMKKRLLTDLYALETLGKPDDLKKNVTGDIEYELWFYNNYNLILKILNGYVIGFMRL